MSRNADVDRPYLPHRNAPHRSSRSPTSLKEQRAADPRCVDCSGFGYAIVGESRVRCGCTMNGRT